MHRLTSADDQQLFGLDLNNSTRIDLNLSKAKIVDVQVVENAPDSDSGPKSNSKEYHNSAEDPYCNRCNQVAYGHYCNKKQTRFPLLKVPCSALIGASSELSEVQQ